MTSVLAPALSRTRFRIAGFGSAVPSARLSNRDLAEQLAIEENWIVDRCGIRSRNVAAAGETTRSLAVAAASQALSGAAGFRPDCVVCTTFTPEFPLCPTAPSIASALGLGPIAAFDLNAACAGGAHRIADRA